MCDITLKIPLAFIFLGRYTQGDDPYNAGVEGLGDPLDGPAFSCGIPSFEQDYGPQAFVFDPFLQLYKFDL